MANFFFNKRLLTVWCGVAICLLQMSCISSKPLETRLGHYYGYQFALRENEKTGNWKKCIYTAENFTIRYIPYYNKVYFSFENKTDSPLDILWDSAYFVVNGQPSNVILGGDPQSLSGNNGYSQIKKGGIYNNYIRSRSFIYFDTAAAGNHWIINDMYPIYDHEKEGEGNSIMGALGKNLFTLHLPIRKGSAVTMYIFTFYPVAIERFATPAQIPKPEWQ